MESDVILIFAGRKKKINLVITKFEFSVAFLYKSYNSFEKWVVFCGNNSVLVKIRGKLI